MTDDPKAIEPATATAERPVIRAASGMELGALLAIAAEALGRHLHASTDVTILMVVGMVILHRILWALFPAFMAKIETAPDSDRKA